MSSLAEGGQPESGAAAPRPQACCASSARTTPGRMLQGGRGSQRMPFLRRTIVSVWVWLHPPFEGFSRTRLARHLPGNAGVGRAGPSAGVGGGVLSPFLPLGKVSGLPPLAFCRPPVAERLRSRQRAERCRQVPEGVSVFPARLWGKAYVDLPVARRPA